MGCRIQIKAFRQLDSVEVTIGFEGDGCETSILIMKEGSKCSRLLTFTGVEFSNYNNNFQYNERANQESGAQEYIVESFATCDNKFLNKLGERIKVGDYYYDDEELRTLIHGLRAVQPYYREGSKNHYIRHLQHHNVNQESFSASKAEEPPPFIPPKPQYSTWGTW